MTARSSSRSDGGPEGAELPKGGALQQYREFIASKRIQPTERGIEKFDVPDGLFPFQRDVLAFLLRVGSGAAFLDTGLGKTFVQLAWADQVRRATYKPVLVLAPLAVGQQTEREAKKFGIDSVTYARDPSAAQSSIVVTNYERLHLFNPADYGGVVLDESSILKSFTGVTTRRLVEAFAAMRFRLACTATPAPNDYMELGQHSEFLGVMDSQNMLMRWFTHDSGETAVWRIKKHAVEPFWDWVSSWARCVCLPSDLGYSDDGFVLPPLNLNRHQVKADITADAGEFLFRIPDTSATSIHKEKRMTANARAQIVADIVRADAGEPWIVWCDTDYEADALAELIPEAIEVRGSMPVEKKEAGLVAFSTGAARVLITKPSIAGFGLNWQHCARVAFAGLSFSYESYYQAIRRCWRFGQQRPVQVHIVEADTERAIWDAVSRKISDHEKMKAEMTIAMRRASKTAILRAPYRPTAAVALPSWLSTSILPNVSPPTMATVPN